MYKAESVFVVQVVYFCLEGVGPFVADKEVDDWWAAKFARREEVSSVFDFSKKGRRMTEGPPDMVFLLQSVVVAVVRAHFLPLLTSATGWTHEVDRMSFMMRQPGRAMLEGMLFHPFCSLFAFSLPSRTRET